MKYFKSKDNSSLLLKLLNCVNKNGIETRINKKDVVKFNSPIFIECINNKNKHIFVDGIKSNPFFPFFKFLWLIDKSKNIEFLEPFGEMSSFEYYCDKNIFSEVKEIILKEGSYSLSTPNGGISFVVDGKFLNLEVYNYQNNGCYINLDQIDFVFYSLVLEYFSTISGLVPNKTSYFYKNVYFDKDKVNIDNIKKDNKFFFLFKGLSTNFYKKKFGKIKNSELLLSNYNDFGSEIFKLDLDDFFSKSVSHYTEIFDDYKNYSYYSQFFNEIVKPMFLSFICYKFFNDKHRARGFINECKQLDLKESVIKYIE